MLVPWLIVWACPGSTVVAPVHGESGVSVERTDAIAVPGPATSGFRRLSRVGPWLEKFAMFPTGTDPLNETFVGSFQFAARQSVQFRRVTHAPAATEFTLVAIALMISSVGWFPTTKFAVVMLVVNRHRSTSQFAGPTTTGVNVNVQVPAIDGPPNGELN